VRLPRALPHRRPIAERLGDWHEVEHTAPDADARAQAGRCMDCGVPFCTNGCPLGNPIPDFAAAVARGRWDLAYQRLAATNDFPDFTGRICPAPCEAACVLALDDAPVTIEATERAIADRAFAEGWVTPIAPARHTGKRVAVVGSGPAGLAAAVQLAERGHGVVIFEASARAGGLLRYGIPDFKLDKSVIDRRLAMLGPIEIVTNAQVGIAPTWTALRDEFDAIVIAIGAQKPRELAIAGRDLDGVIVAMDYLVDQNEALADGRATRFDLRGKHVVILGGGDTGSDCLGTALRQGAAQVTQIELVPPPPIGRNPATPWPAWPIVFRTSSSQEEGGARAFGFRTTGFAGTNGRLSALHGIEVAREAGRLVDVPGTERVMPADAVVLALGFTGANADALIAQLGVKLDGYGNIAVDARYETNITGVFCAGDAQRGASLVVWAIAEGRAAAHHVDSFLAAS
jgi:glutamate synthase (NADPH/NADH) small chain